MRHSPFIGVVTSLFLLAGAEALGAGPSKAIIGFPTLGQSGLSRDIYLYTCSDSTCQSITQLSDYGHITNVAGWPKSYGGPGGPTPQVWVFLNLDGATDQYFQFWQNYQGGWQSCIFQITPMGDIGSGTTCVGVVSVAPPPGVSGNLPNFDMGVAMFSASGSSPDGPNPPPSNLNSVPKRSITYVNQTSNFNVCLQTDSSFNHKNCSNGGITIAQGGSYAINVPSNGINSGLGQIAAIKPKKNGLWINTGQSSPQGQVYASNFEYTIWPYTQLTTPGPITVDISLVNGFNIGARLSPTGDTACAIANSEGGTPYFILYSAGSTMATFPNQVESLSMQCPNGYAVTNATKNLGCYSACSYAEVYEPANVDAFCCLDPYNTAETCTEPPNTPYVQNVTGNSTRVYSWAFQDYLGTFTCEPAASFTFTLIDAFSDSSR